MAGNSNVSGRWGACCTRWLRCRAPSTATRWTCTRCARRSSSATTLHCPQTRDDDDDIGFRGATALITGYCDKSLIVTVLPYHYSIDPNILLGYCDSSENFAIPNCVTISDYNCNIILKESHVIWGIISQDLFLPTHVSSGREWNNFGK